MEDPKDYRSHWASPDLLLSQCCGYHIATKVQQLEVVGAPEFRPEGLLPGEYRSVVVRRKLESKKTTLLHFRGCRAAVNEDQSFSGYTALLCAIPAEHFRPDFFSEKLETGSHYESMQAVVDGDADVAAIDQISWRLIVKEPHGRKLKNELDEIQITQNVQAPPYVTSPSREPEEIDIIRDTLVTVSLRKEVRSALESMDILSIVDATNEDYLPLAKEIQRVERAAGGVSGMDEQLLGSPRRPI